MATISWFGMRPAATLTRAAMQANETAESPIAAIPRETLTPAMPRRGRRSESALSIRSIPPMYGRSASGMTTLPSRCWKFSAPR